MSRVLAFDVGAGSYRVIEGTYQDGEIQIREVERFKHTPVYKNEHYYWDVLSMHKNMVHVLQECSVFGEPVLSIGFDTFGTDFALISEPEGMLEMPLSYRDSISDGIYERHFLQEEKLYEDIGATYELPGTAHILAGMKETDFLDLEKADRILLMPDLLTWMFTGVMVNEYTIATTTKLLNIKDKSWNKKLIQEIKIPNQIFQSLTEPGQIAGTLKKEIRGEIPNLQTTVVTTTACHDTASAVATIPDMDSCSFISSGSWSVKGIISGNPYTSKQAFESNMVNEGLAYGKYRLLRNITGLWILEECIRSWKAEGNTVELSTLVQKAEVMPEFPSMIYTDSELFKKPGNMPEKIQRFCKETGQIIPRNPAEYMSAIVKGLACEYRKHNEELYEVTGTHIHTLYIVGGGRHNRYLNQCTANVTGCKVICGHPEATGLGNMLIQLKAHGIIKSEKEFANIVSRNVAPVIYEPNKEEQRDSEYKIYLKIRENADKKKA